MIKFGVTNYAEPTLDTSWIEKLNDSSIGKYILTTVNPGGFIYSKLEEIIKNRNNIVINTSLTGYAKTSIEPNTISVKANLMNVNWLIDAGYKTSITVGIIPTETGLKTLADVLKMIKTDLGDNYSKTKLYYQFIQLNNYNIERGLELPWRTDLPPQDDMNKAYKIVDEYTDYKYINHMFDNCKEEVELLEPQYCGYNCMYCFNENKYNDDCEINENP